MNAKTKPQRNSAHRKEDKSKREFEELIDPFFVSGWNTKDYGIDCVVEITTESDSFGNAELESKCFLVQLKATEKITKSKNSITFSVPVKKIIYWYNYNLPVLFVLYDIKTNTFYYQWIDELLIAALEGENNNWTDQKTITIRILPQNKLEKHYGSLLADYVSKWKMPSRRKLVPGKYFQMKGKGYDFIQQYKLLISSFGFQSVNEAIKNMETALDLSMYRIALTGPSRVGKSSLINGILKKEISPTGFFQTTGVPIQIIPGAEDKVTLYFNNKPQLYLPFTLENVTNYASQEYNEDNKKGVRLISISVKNQQLERGVSLFDIPGLDDPSDEILDYTWQTVKKVNAVIYVVDASPAQDGGYIFRNDYKKHITIFSQSQDKVFLVFNKVDK
jgi:GTPase SAR1 family protein